MRSLTWSCRSTLFTSVAIPLLLIASTSDAVVGRTSGGASVSSTGAGQYTIPIWSPPGAGGMRPQLAVTYSSTLHNGLLGMGMAVAGLSSIERCPKTIAQDGVGAPVTLTLSDVFCLDGERLRLESGTYGQSGSVYRTEREGFSKVIASGAAGNGPASFEVWSKDGRILEYGTSTDSRIESIGGTARAWALAVMRDRAGNRIEFKYIEDGNGYRPDEINYATNIGAGVSTAPYQVKFFYEPTPRPDPIYGYFAGGAVNEFYRLDRIEVRHQGSAVKIYDVAYEPGGGAGGRSRVASITECSTSLSVCLSPTTFNWTTTSSGLTSESNSGTGNTTLMMDVDGDGRDDALYSSGGTLRLRKSNGTAFGSETNTGIADANWAGAQALEWDGDGRMDLLVNSGGTWSILRSNGSGFDAPFNTGITVSANTRAYDVNGDGRDDLLRVSSSGAATVWVRYREASNFGAETQLWTSGDPNVLFYGLPSGPLVATNARQRSAVRRPDFNGDNRQDFIAGVRQQEYDPEVHQWIYTDQVWAFMPLSGAMAISGLSAPQNMAANHPMWADFNGDGLTDVVWQVNGAWRVQLSRGGGFAGTINGPTTTSSWTHYAVFMDYDGDGRHDILVPNATTGAFDLVRSTGNGLAGPTNTGMTWVSWMRPYAAEVSGDGYFDLVYLEPNTLTLRSRLHVGTPADHLATVTDGFGVQASFTYAPLTDATVYTKGSGAVYPEVDIMSPRFVVKQMTSTDGSGNGTTFTMSYAYETARLNLHGRGFLGFARRTATDPRFGYNQKTEENYLQTFPYTGLPASLILKQSTGTKIREVINSWSALPYSSGYSARFYPYVYSATRKLYEVGGTYNGTHFATITTTLPGTNGVNGIDSVSGLIFCGFRRCRATIPIHVGPAFRSMPAGVTRYRDFRVCVGRSSTVL